jgi:hypothetical protein
MLPDPDATQDSGQPPETPTLPARRRSPIRRLGCIVLVAIWFLILLIPCFFISLAVNDQIVLPQGSAPGQELRFWLVMETERRGVGMSSTSAHWSDDNHVCIQTDARFLLWSGQGQPVSYCTCYTRSGSDSEWTSGSSQSGSCSP